MHPLVLLPWQPIPTSSAPMSHLPLACQPKVIARLSISWVWVASSQAIHRHPQVSLSLVPLAAPQVPLQS